MYGYELVQAIGRPLAASLEFGEGCIYPILHRLEAKRLLVASRQTVAGRQRVVYSHAQGQDAAGQHRLGLAATWPPRSPRSGRRRT